MTVLKLKYFSWVRERIGVDEELVEVPENVRTLGELMVWQSTRGEQFEQVFSNAEFIRIAVDMKHVTDMELELAEAREIAMFPPMTGG